ncbi:MAG: hypothetical protein C5B50_21515 [Verrucomicrobia bacterium]|nr:MAG: hypothetical protein C5B50_21515 [Verrucomicrobiota bacterium]
MNSSPADCQQRLVICGVSDLERQCGQDITHLITISNPGAPCSKPNGFIGEHLQLWFGDVVSEEDARQCRTKAPTVEDVRAGVEFFRKAWLQPKSKLLVSCDYGASRSPALAYVGIADQLGSGHESEALRLILQIRPEAVPNSLVVRLGDTFMSRRGALLEPLTLLYAQINEEISKFRRS